MSGPTPEINVADVIRAAAGSALGVVSLLALLMAGLAYVFFRQASERVRIWIFLVLLVAAIGLGVAVLRSANEAQPQKPYPQPTPTVKVAPPKPKSVAPRTEPVPPPQTMTFPKTQTCPNGMIIPAGDSCGEFDVRFQVEMNDDYCTGPNTHRACRNAKTRFPWTLSLDDKDMPSLLVSTGVGLHKFDIQSAGVDGICELSLNRVRDNAKGYVVSMHVKNRGTYQKPNFHLLGCTLDDTLKAA